MTEQAFAAAQQLPSMPELMIQELQNRIGQITSQYETQLAGLKAHAMQEIQQRDNQLQELRVALINAKKASNDKEAE